MLSVLKEYIQRVINEEMNNFQYPEGSYKNKQFRIPFEEYGNGNSYIDIYIDWLKAVSKKGTLPKPSVNFKEMVYRGISRFHNNKHANRELVEPEYGIARNYMDRKELHHHMTKESTLFNDAKFDDNGNLYVERQIGVYVNDIHQETPTLFNDLTKSYNNTVGGCWSFRKGKGDAYCSETNANFFITFKGYMFLDDIYWDELVRLETRDMHEYEVRTYPNGRVQLEEIQLYHKDNGTNVTLTVKDFDGPRIINSTFLGNNAKFDGEIAPLGFQKIGYEKQFIDREGNEYKDIDGVVTALLNKGKKIEEIFETIQDIGGGFKKVKFKKKYNVVNQNNKLITHNWFIGVGSFNDGFINVFDTALGANFIDGNGNFLSKTWFNSVHPFKNGLAVVKKDDKWNFILNNGNLLSKTWFDNVGDFNEEYAPIRLNVMSNFINKNGELLFKKRWVDNADNFYEGLAVIVVDGNANFINKNRELLSDKWFVEANRFSEGYGAVQIPGKGWNFIDKNGRLLFSNMSFKDVGEFKNGFANVQLQNDLCNFIDKQGKLLFPNGGFDNIEPFVSGMANVSLNGKKYIVDTDGNIFDDKFNLVNLFENVLRKHINRLVEEAIRDTLK